MTQLGEWCRSDVSPQSQENQEGPCAGMRWHALDCIVTGIVVVGLMTCGLQTVWAQSGSDQIVIIPGQLRMPYTHFGEVSVSTAGTVHLGAGLSPALSQSELAYAASRKLPLVKAATVNRLLREKVHKQYGKQVNAVVNTVYKTGLDGHVQATGSAVYYVEPDADKAQVREAGARIEQLQAQCDKGEISPQEYEKKRAAIIEKIESQSGW